MYNFLGLLLVLSVSALDLDNSPSNAELLRMIQDLNATRVTRSVGFFARLDGSDVQLGLNQAIIFNTVITNEGGGYDARHGHFTAPVQGLYDITTSVMSLSEKIVALDIVKNGALVDNLWSHGHFENTITKNVVINMNKGDMVWVRQTGGTNYVGEIVHARHCTFSGHLI